MAKKERYPDGYYQPFRGSGESEGSGSSGRIEIEITGSEDSSVPVRKCINLNSDRFGVPIQVHSLSKLSSSEKKDLVIRLKAELEQIRIFQKKVESQPLSGATLSSCSDILSCNTGENRVPLLTSGKESKENPFGHRARGWNRGLSGRFESVQQASVPSSSITMIMKQCDTLLKRLMSHKYGWVFNTPVDVVKLNIPDYITVIKHPMDLGAIKGKLASGAYSSPHDFLADVRLTFSNAMTYNPPGNDFHIMAQTLSKFFEVRWKSIEKKLPPADSAPLTSKLGPRKEAEPAESLPPAKKMKFPPMKHNIIPEPVLRIMTTEEKTCLSRELETLLGELPDNIIDFLKAHCSNGADTGDDEIEIDLDALSNDTLFQLRNLLDEYLQDKRKNQAKMAEPCEIELLHGSGLSNSSMQPGKGNDPADEDVDIGGSEPPVSSYPPVEIDKGSGHRTDSESSSSSESESDDAKAPLDVPKGHDTACSGKGLNKRGDQSNAHDDNQSVDVVDQVDQNLQKQNSETECSQDGETAPGEKQVLPEKLYRAALLKSRFADTILKAREKTLSQDDKGDPEKLRREREELEMQRRKEKARLLAEAKAAEDARKRAEAEAAAEAKRKRELEREAARQALQQMEKTVEINENCRILEDLEMLRTAPADHLPSSVDETSPDHSQEGLGGFMFNGSNPLEQLGLYMKQDEEEEEGEPPIQASQAEDAEEGEI
ncbi:hypothetical protein Ancab_027003 [Ancistrocladus abbreviatus]